MDMYTVWFTVKSGCVPPLGFHVVNMIAVKTELKTIDSCIGGRLAAESHIRTIWMYMSLEGAGWPSWP